MPNSLNTAEKTTPAMIPRIIPMAIQMSLERAKFLIFLFFGRKRHYKTDNPTYCREREQQIQSEKRTGRHNCILSVILGRLAIIIRLRLSILLIIRSGILILRLGILRLGLLCSILLGGFHPSSAFGAEYSIIRHLKPQLEHFLDIGTFSFLNMKKSTVYIIK